MALVDADDPFIKPDEAAALLGMTRRWVMREGVAKDKLLYYQPPGSNQIRFRLSYILKVRESWLANPGAGIPKKGGSRSKRRKKVKV